MFIFIYPIYKISLTNKNPLNSNLYKLVVQEPVDQLYICSTLRIKHVSN